MDTASLREKVKLARSEKWRILKNIATVSFAFMVQFTAFQVNIIKSNLTSSLINVFYLNFSREQQIYSHQLIRKIL